MSDDLVKRLREECYCLSLGGAVRCYPCQAADRIEALQRLCGRAAEFLDGEHRQLSDTELIQLFDKLLAELREASK